MTVLFFISVFTSLTWLVYIILYIVGQLGGNDLSALPPATLAIYAALAVFPVWTVWQAFGFINQYFRSKAADVRLTQLFNQMKKNQDYTDLVVRVMLDAEHEIKDGFVINKFDIFIADMNEILADIVFRCNAASTLQLEQLWARVKNGERWTIGKTLAEAAKNHNDFGRYLAEKAAKDSIFKGTLREFCSRYQNLHALLEKHDRDRVFINIIETGVLGKVYAILAPVAESLEYTPQTPVQAETAEEDAYKPSSRILNMESPESKEIKPDGFWQRLNPFARKKGRYSDDNPAQFSDDDEFFAALQKSMASPEQTRQSFQMQESGTEPEFLDAGSQQIRTGVQQDEHPIYDGPRFDLSFNEEEMQTPDLENMNKAENNSAGDDFEDNIEPDRGVGGNTGLNVGFAFQSEAKSRDEQTTVLSSAFEISTLGTENTFERFENNMAATDGESRLKAMQEAGEFSNADANAAGLKMATAAEKNTIFEKKTSESTTARSDENFAYPFGGWIDENNYKK